MNTIQTVAKKGVFKNGVNKGKRFTIINKQYEFVEGVWGLIKAFMIDFEPFVEVQSVNIPRSFLLRYNVIFPFRKSNNIRNGNIDGLVQFKMVSDFIKLLMAKERQDFMTIEEADAEDEDDCGLEGYYLPQYGIFLADFNIQGGGNCPVVLPNNYSGSSPMAYAVGNIIDDDGNEELTRGLRKRDVLKRLCFDKYAGFLKEMMHLKRHTSLTVSGFPKDVAFLN